MQNGLNGIREALFNARLYDEPVHDDLDIVLDILVKLNLVGQLVHIAVDHHAEISALPCLLENLLVPPLPASDDRGEQLDPAPFRKRHDPVDHLIHGLLFDHAPAVGAVRDPDPGI